MTVLVALTLFLAVAQERSEPAWAHSALQDGRPEFQQIRKELQTRYGEFVRYAFISRDKPKEALAAYDQSRRPDAFRALYLWIASGEDSANGSALEKLWIVLPSDEYEVARLHFLWDSDVMHKLSGLGDRLLAKDGKDVEVLVKMTMTRCMIRPDQDLAKAEALAERALRLKPCASTYFAYAYVKSYGLEATMPSARADARVAKDYMEKFLKSANPKDYRIAIAKSMLDWLKKNGY